MTPTEFRIGAISPVDCFREGWELIKSDYWILFAVTLVGMIIGGASMYILLGAMMCGIYYCYLLKIDGGKVNFESLFKGLNYLLPSLLVTILIVVPMILVFGVIYLPVIAAAAMGSNLKPDTFLTLMGGALIVELVLAIVMVCLHTLLIFTFPLIIDRGLSATDAIRTSARAVLKNLGGVAGLMGVSLVLTFVGYLALCIGLYFVIPVILAGFTVAYRRIFPAINQPNVNIPPSPDAFRGAGNYN